MSRPPTKRSSKGAPSKPRRAGRPSRPSRGKPVPGPGWPGRAERAEREARAARPGPAERAERAGRAARPEQPGRGAERTERPARGAERPERPARPARGAGRPGGGRPEERRRPAERLPSPQAKERRAFTPARTPGRVERGGDEPLARALADALLEPQRDREDTEGLTHFLHSYPARLHPATARRLVALAMRHTAGAADAAPAQPVLLDPFCGSGTVLVEAHRAGARAIGVDANPLAVLIARAKTWTVPAERREALRQAGQRMAAAALAEGKAARRADYEAPAMRTTPGIDVEARNQRLLHWFAPHVRRELEHLASQIDELREGDPELADILTVVLSSTLYKVSRRASDTDPTMVERRIARGAAARLFGQRVEQLAQGLAQLARSARAAAAEVHGGDARHLDRVGVGDGSVDAVLTSPPYAGTYDYTEQHQLRLDFLGMQAQAFQEAELGSRRQFGGDATARRRARRRFTRALGSSLDEIARVLRPGGVALVVLGDSMAGDKAIFADEVIRAAAGERFDVRAWAGQERTKLGQRERDAFGDAPKREWIFLLARQT